MINYLPPLLVYLAYGVSGLTAVAGTFVIKDQLGLGPEALAAVGFWAGIPWALKMPMGHIVDIYWKYKGWLVVLGATLMAASLGIMLAIVSGSVTSSADSLFVLSAILAPTGYVIQDVVADAMTVDAVPLTEPDGTPRPEADIKAGHNTMQTLGRMAVVSGGLGVALANVLLFHNVASEDMQATYVLVYQLALAIPIVSVLGVALHAVLHRGSTPSTSTKADTRILGGSAAYVAVVLAVGLSGFAYSQELVFVLSMAIVVALVGVLIRELPPESRKTLIVTAALIWVFRAMPTNGAGAGWWQIDVLGFDQEFMAQLGLIGGALALIGMVLLRAWMGRQSITRVVVYLSVFGGLLSIPLVGMFYGLHHWTAGLTGGLVDARFIAVVDTALESPFGQLAMIPLLAWIANNAPAHLKATYFATMSALSNLALSASALGTRYLSLAFPVSRGSYDELGGHMVVVSVVVVVVPLLAALLASRAIKKAA